VIALAREHAHCALLGNHELASLNYRRTGDPSHFRLPLGQLSAKDWAYLSTMP